MAGGTVTQGGELLSDDSQGGQRATRANTPDVHMPCTKGIGRRIELLLNKPRLPALLAVKPPMGEEFQFGYRDAAAREYPTQVGRRQPAVPAGTIIFHRQPDGGKAGRRRGRHSLLKGKAGRVTDRSTGERII